jgi:hypothetical protein
VEPAGGVAPPVSWIRGRVPPPRGAGVRGWGRGNRTLARAIQSRIVDPSKAPVDPAGIEPAPPRVRAEHADVDTTDPWGAAELHGSPEASGLRPPAGLSRSTRPGESAATRDARTTWAPEGATVPWMDVVLAAFAAERWPGVAPGSSGWRPELLLVELPPQSVRRGEHPPRRSGQESFTLSIAPTRVSEPSSPFARSETISNTVSEKPPTFSTSSRSATCVEAFG